MIILGQTKAWFANKYQPDLIEDIKRKLFITPMLIITNIQIIGVSVVVLVLNKYVFLYNLLAMAIGFIVLILVYLCCRCTQDEGFIEELDETDIEGAHIETDEYGRTVNVDDPNMYVMSKIIMPPMTLTDFRDKTFFYLSIWLTWLSVWALANSGYYEEESIVKNGYIYYITGVIIATSPWVYIFTPMVIAGTLTIAFGFLSILWFFFMDCVISPITKPCRKKEEI